MTPASIIVDGPFCVYQGARLGQKCFRNFGGGSGSGPHTLRWGIEQSRNLMTVRAAAQTRSEEHTTEHQSLMRISSAVFCLKKKNKNTNKYQTLIRHSYT